MSTALDIFFEGLRDAGEYKNKQEADGMGSTGMQGVAGIAVVLCSALAGATDLTLHLKGVDPVKRNTVQFQCDAQGAKMGLPAGTFAVEYLNGAGNHLAVVPVKGNSMIFVTVPSGSGAKYAAEEFTWWDAGGRGTTFASDFPGPKASSACHVVK